MVGMISNKSYGGHYGPTLAQWIVEQNKRVRSGDIKGIEIPIATVGIVNG
jgi:hypothetical protein